MRALCFILLIIPWFSLPVAYASDCWLSVHGAGNQDGSSEQNAYSAKSWQNAQKCWNQTGEDGTMHVLSGEYSRSRKTFWSLIISPSNDGKPGKIKTLRGEGIVKLLGSRPIPYQSKYRNHGGIWIEISAGASHLSINHFDVSQVALGIQAFGGENHNLHFSHLNFQDTQQNIFLYGHPLCRSKKKCAVKSDKISHNIRIEAVNGIRYSKRHIRLDRGVHNVQVLDSHADSVYLDEDFAVGFDVENPSHHISFVRCSSRGNAFTQSKYWNGDGFKAEGETHDIEWRDCAAFDNADAGFDIKTPKARLMNIIALRNNRNVRIWSSEASYLFNVNASYAHHMGGEGGSAGIWTEGELECHYCTLHNNAVQLMAENNHHRSPKARFYDSLISTSDASSFKTFFLNADQAKVDFVRTAFYNSGVSGLNPEYQRETSAWNGGNQDFNSRVYGKSKGYFYVRDDAPLPENPWFQALKNSHFFAFIGWIEERKNKE